MLRPDDPHQLWRRYALALGVVVALLSASHWASLRALSGGEEAAAVINVSGRQRMLSQRILYFSADAVTHPQGASDPRLAEAVDLFERSHRALALGGDLGLSPKGAAERAPVYRDAAQGRTLDEMTRAFIDDARAVTGAAGPERAAAWDRMRRDGPGPLLARLDGAVRAFEEDARARTRLTRRVAQGTFALALAVLAGEALLIFWPAQRMVVRAMDRLRGANAALEGARRETAARLAEARAARAEAEEARAEAEEALRVRERFLANMSHEIRTPLNGVLGMLELLRDAPLDPGSRERAQVAHASADHLMGLLGDVLDLSRLESGHLAVERAPLDPAEVAAGVVALFADQAAAKGLALRVEPRGPLPPRVLGDALRLRQVIANLVGNALKFTEAGGVTIALGHDAGDGAEGGGRLRVEVRDTGSGIAPEARARLFEPFEQADASATRRHGGSGLGLAICRELVTLMGGAIAAESAPGRGSVFRFEIMAPPAAEGPRAEGAGGTGAPDGRPGRTPAPVREAPRPRAARPLQAAPPLRAARPLRVLVAEDNAVNRTVAEALLRKLGHEARCVGDGAAAVEAVEAVAAGGAAGIDLVLMDVQMPVMDGLAATRAIRALAAPASEVPIVALTANVMEGEIRTCLAAGMDGHLSKPVRSAALAEGIADAMWRAGARRVASSGASDQAARTRRGTSMGAGG